MSMIRTVCSFCFALFLLAAVPVFAQEASWPRTFSGQPDFDFQRSIIVQELQDKKKELGFEPFIANMQDLLTDRKIDPFTPKPRYRRSPSTKKGDTTANPFLPTQLVDNEAVAITNSEDISLTGLPEYDIDLSTLDLSLLSPSDNVSETVVDVKDFEKFLNRVAGKQTLEFEKPDLTIYDYSGEVQNLTLQSISTSPVKYVVIKNQRYTEGDQFSIAVKISPKPLDIGKIIDQHMPSALSVPAETFKEYVALRDKAVKEYEARAKKASQEASAGYHNITVTVKKIEHRKVKLDIFDRSYSLKLKLLL